LALIILFEMFFRRLQGGAADEESCGGSRRKSRKFEIGSELECNESVQSLRKSCPAAQKKLPAARGARPAVKKRTVAAGGMESLATSADMLGDVDVLHLVTPGGHNTPVPRR
jgi:hypothetical protein